MPKFANVDAYLAALPAQSRTVVAEIGRRVVAVAPESTPAIRYDMPTWQLDGTSLVHVAAWKQHVSIYPTPPEGDADLDRDLAPYSGDKGTMKFPYDDVPYDLIQRAVARLRETRT